MAARGFVIITTVNLNFRSSLGLMRRSRRQPARGGRGGVGGRSGRRAPAALPCCGLQGG